MALCLWIIACCVYVHSVQYLQYIWDIMLCLWVIACCVYVHCTVFTVHLIHNVHWDYFVLYYTWTRYCQPAPGERQFVSRVSSLSSHLSYLSPGHRQAFYSENTTVGPSTSSPKYVTAFDADMVKRGMEWNRRLWIKSEHLLWVRILHRPPSKAGQIIRLRFLSQVDQEVE